MNDSERIESPCAAGKPNSPASGPLVRGERLCVVMPVYNERDAIGGVLRKWSAMLDELGLDYVIRPYNDGSKDDSLAAMRAAAASLPHAEVHDKPNGGHGPTILRGYLEAADGFDWVFQVDSDDEMGPEHFAELWKRRGDFDFLVGRRAGRSQALVRKTISFVSRVVVRLFFGRSRVWDVNSPYRLMRVSALAPVFCSIPETTFAPNIIITGMSARLGLRTLELPVPQHDRTTGEVSIRKWRLFRAAVRSLCQTVVYSFASSSPSPSPPGLRRVYGLLLSAGRTERARVVSRRGDVERANRRGEVQRGAVVCHPKRGSPHQAEGVYQQGPAFHAASARARVRPLLLCGGLRCPQTPL